MHKQIEIYYRAYQIISSLLMLPLGFINYLLKCALDIQTYQYIVCLYLASFKLDCCKVIAFRIPSLALALQFEAC